MKGRLNSLAATRAMSAGFVGFVTHPVSLRCALKLMSRPQTNSVRYKVLIVGLAFFYLPSVFCTAFAQGQTITVGVLEFTDERTEQSVSVAPEIGRKLAQKLNAVYKDVLARNFNRVTDASSIQAMTVEQLGALGKQQGVQFVVRGGLLPPGEGDSGGETKAAIQLYALIVSVETSSTKSVRVTGDSATKDQALSSAIEQLAASIHQAIVSPTADAAAPQESPQDTTGATNPPEDSTEASAAETDEEVQQLIAQAESLVADGSSISGERLSSVSKALESLKAALEAKATLLEEGKDATSADQEITKQKDSLQNSLSSLVESEMPGAVDAPSEQGEQPSGEKKNLLTRIDGYAGEALSIIQKIQEIRAAFRGATGNSEQMETSGPASTEEAALSEEEAPLATEESTEEVSGVITEMGEPVAGVTVTEPESGAKAETDSNGSYALEGVPAGRLAKLVVTKSGKQMAMGQIEVTRGRKSIADFELKEQTAGASKSALRILPSTVRLARTKTGTGNVGVLKGVVKDAQGRPAGRALVRLGRTMARTDSQGRYVFLNVPPGVHKIIVQRSGSRPRTEMVQVSAQKSSESKIQFAPADRIATVRSRQTLIVRGTGTVLRGVVFDLQKRPLAGAKVTVVQQTSVMSVLAGLRGTYLLRNLRPGAYRVMVSKAGYVPTAQTVNVQAGEMQPRDFQLRKTDSPFIERALARRRSNQSRVAGELNKTDQRVNREDHPRAKVTSASLPVRVDASAGSVSGRVSNSRIEARRPPIPAGSAEIGKGQLSGRIVDAKTGKPVAGAFISVVGRQPVTSDRDGSYAFKDLAPGPYRVIARKSEFLDVIVNLMVRAGETTKANLRLNLKPLNRVR